jgi:hypothetical protein
LITSLGLEVRDPLRLVRHRQHHSGSDILKHPKEGGGFGTEHATKEIHRFFHGNFFFIFYDVFPIPKKAWRNGATRAGCDYARISLGLFPSVDYNGFVGPWH